MNADLARLELIERAAVAEEVASVLRHDLRGKMGVVLNAVYYIRKKLAGTPVFEADPRIGVFCGLMEDEVGAVELLLTERIGFRKHFAKKTETETLGPAVELAAAWFRARFPQGPRVEIEPAPRSAPLQIDRCDVALAIDCLLRNAAEAAPGEPIRVAIETAGGEVAVVVSDRGPGIAADQIERAITPLFTTKDGHLGIGLNVASRLVTRHGGGLRIDSGTSRVRLVFRMEGS